MAEREGVWDTVGERPSLRRGFDDEYPGGQSHLAALCGKPDELDADLVSGTLGAIENLAGYWVRCMLPFVSPIRHRDAVIGTLDEIEDLAVKLRDTLATVDDGETAR